MFLFIISKKFRHEEYSLKVEKNKKFKDFLSKAIELLPESNCFVGF